MTVSTDAILFYGYCWDEEDAPDPWKIDSAKDDDEDDDEEDDEEDNEDEEDDGEEDEDDDCWEERYARAKGCLPPSTPYPERAVTPTRENGWSPTPKDYSAAEKAIIDQHKAYWEAKRTLVEKATCCVDRHCMASCPMAYVAVTASRTTSYRGDMNEITSLAVDPAWGTALAEFCALMGIKTDGKKAAWWLVSDWSE